MKDLIIAAIAAAGLVVLSGAANYDPPDVGGPARSGGAGTRCALVAAGDCGECSTSGGTPGVWRYDYQAGKTVCSQCDGRQ